MLTDDEYAKFWRKSATHFNNSLRKQNITYINDVNDCSNSVFLELMKEHRKWSDER